MAGLIDLGINYRKQAMDAMGGVAQRETERQNFNRKMAAQEKAAKCNAAGQGLGMGYMAYNSGALGKAADVVLPEGASKAGILDFLTPAQSAGQTAAANVAQQGGNALEAPKAINAVGTPAGYAPADGSLPGVPMPAGSSAATTPGAGVAVTPGASTRSEEHTSELQSLRHIV